MSQAELSAGASMQFNLKSRLQSLKLVSGLATFLKIPESLEGVFAVSRSLQNSALPPGDVSPSAGEPRVGSPGAGELASSSD